MNIIKSITAAILCICTTTVLHAQELKTEVLKAPAPDLPKANYKASPQPEPKLQPEATPLVADKPAKTEEDATKKEEQKLLPGKTEARIINEADIVSPGGVEGKKILAGNKPNPALTSMMPSSATPPVTPPKPPVSKTRQQQQQ